jgi:hypothetical protein
MSGFKSAADAVKCALAAGSAALFVMSVALTFLRKGMLADVCFMAALAAAFALLALSSQL